MLLNSMAFPWCNEEMNPDILLLVQSWAQRQNLPGRGSRGLSRSGRCRGRGGGPTVAAAAGLGGSRGLRACKPGTLSQAPHLLEEHGWDVQSCLMKTNAVSKLLGLLGRLGKGHHCFRLPDRVLRRVQSILSAWSSCCLVSRVQLTALSRDFLIQPPPILLHGARYSSERVPPVSFASVR